MHELKIDVVEMPRATKICIKGIKMFRRRDIAFPYIKQKCEYQRDLRRKHGPKEVLQAKSLQCLRVSIPFVICRNCTAVQNHSTLVFSGDSRLHISMLILVENLDCLCVEIGMATRADEEAVGCSIEEPCV